MSFDPTEMFDKHWERVNDEWFLVHDEGADPMQMEMNELAETPSGRRALKKIAKTHPRKKRTEAIKKTLSLAVGKNKKKKRTRKAEM